MTFVSIGGDAWIEKVQLPSEPTDAFPLVVSNDRALLPRRTSSASKPMPNVMEKEPNNSFKESTPGQLPGAFCGVLGEPGDTDYFSFQAKKGQTANIKVYGRKGAAVGNRQRRQRLQRKGGTRRRQR